jgi:hypothetical protein
MLELRPLCAIDYIINTRHMMIVACSRDGVRASTDDDDLLAHMTHAQ